MGLRHAIERSQELPETLRRTSTSTTNLEVILEFSLASEGYLGVLERVDDVVHLNNNMALPKT